MLKTIDLERYIKISQQESYPLLMEGADPTGLIAGGSSLDNQFLTTKNRGSINGVTFMPTNANNVTSPNSDLMSFKVTANLGGAEFINDAPVIRYSPFNYSGVRQKIIKIGVDGFKSQTLNSRYVNDSGGNYEVQPIFYRENPYIGLNKYNSHGYGLKTQTYLTSTTPSNIEVPAGSGDIIGFDITTARGLDVSVLVNLSVNGVTVIKDVGLMAFYVGGKMPKFRHALYIAPASTIEFSVTNGGSSDIAALTLYFAN